MLRKVRKGAKPSKNSTPKFVLPQEKNVISNDLLQYIWLIYGERKIGKTTLFSEFDDVLFILFDPPNKGLEIYQLYAQSWLDFLDIITLLEENPDYCKMVVIDTGFMAYERCFAHVCREHNVKDPRDKGWSVVWKDIAKQFVEAHDRILALNLGLGIAAHSEVREISRRDGTSYNKLTTQLPGAAFKYYNGLCDVIAYYQYNPKGNRELVLKGDAMVEAGTRIQKHFKFSDGSPVDVIPMGKSQQEAFKNLTLAFNNKLKKPLKKKKSSLRNK